MAFEFKLPDIGEGVVEGELTRWMVEDGQQVQEDSPLFEVLTDKVSAVIPSPRAGKVVRRHFGEGDMVPVGAVVVTIEESGGAATAAPSSAEVAPAAAAAPAPAAQAPASGAKVATAVQRDPGERVRAAPATRKLARELGVELLDVPASGDEGRVTRDDVQAWAARVSQGDLQTSAAPTKAASPPSAQPKPARAATAMPAGPDETRERLKGLRKRIHAKMRESKDIAAHFTYVDEIDFTQISAMRAALELHGVKATFLPFVVKAVCLALKKPEFAYLNASVDDAAGEIVVKRRYHIGIAAATDAGLLVPVVQDADRLTLVQLIGEIRRLGDGARLGTLGAEDLSGSTFTITSLGKLGGMFATPIINYPEAAILGLHKVEKRPVVVDDQIVIRERMYLSCSFDHRLIDGHVGAAFVQAIRTYLESPVLLMSELA